MSVMFLYLRAKDLHLRGDGRTSRDTPWAKSQCVAQSIPLGEGHLRTAVREYTERYHAERKHQGLEDELIEDRCGVADSNGDVERGERLGGILNDCDRRAA